MELPHLTTAEIEAELKGTEYADHLNKKWYDDALLNAARAIRLARENEELKTLLLQERASSRMNGSLMVEEHRKFKECVTERARIYAEALEAACKMMLEKFWEAITDKYVDAVRALPNPYKKDV